MPAVVKNQYVFLVECEILRYLGYARVGIPVQTKMTFRFATCKHAVYLLFLFLQGRQWLVAGVGIG